MTKQTLILAGSALLILGLLIGCGSGSGGIAGGSFEGLPTAALPNALGTIIGIVSDSSGVPVSGASVTLSLNGTAVANAVSGADGSYSLSASPMCVRITGKPVGNTDKC
ncbi:MAG: carboxypeptidase regulatory-like domain-containing protein [Candidatus Riflebacteria bacterium]|nr:carboxypeptidase regulatory-like domain-containing protein [Candidatus Riflebacteria bacterium]